MIVVIDGREYILAVHGPNCDSLTHGHDAPHADGSPGLPYHHHCQERCQDLPVGATLYPVEVQAVREIDFVGYAAMHSGGTELSEVAAATAKKARRRAREEAAAVKSYGRRL